MTSPGTPAFKPSCSTCGATLTAPFRFCAGCGREGDDRCASCGRVLAADETICNGCSTPRNASSRDTPIGANTWDVLLSRLREGLKGEFRVTRELGRGGQAAVYLAEELALRRQVAIKVLARNASYLDDSVVARFQAEARIIAGFRHPNIVTVYSIRKLGALPYFIMQYLEGLSLADVLVEKKILAWSLASAVLYQVGSALEYAHARGVVHRDVKPANIIFDEDGNAVVTDFGIAKKLKDSNTNTTTSLIGTPAYMSPEQCNGDNVTPKSDQYALGVVAYQLVCGRVPFEGTELMVLHGHTEDAVPPIAKFVRNCPPQIEAAIMRMLAKQPEDRWPSMHDALDALGATELEDDDPRRAALRAIALSRQPDRGRALTPTFAFAPRAGAQIAQHVPAEVNAATSAQRNVVPEHPHELLKTSASTVQPIAIVGAPLLRRVPPRAAVAVGALLLLGMSGSYAMFKRKVAPVAPAVASVPATPAPALPETAETTLIAGVTISGFSDLVTVGESQRARLEPTSASGSNVRWGSAMSRVRIDAMTGQFTGQRSGTDTIFAAVAGGRIAERRVRVTVVKDLSLSYMPALHVGDVKDLTVRPTTVEGDLVDKTPRFEVDAQDVVSVTSDGLTHAVHALREGKAVITIVVDGFRKRLEVEVLPPG